MKLSGRRRKHKMDIFDYVYGMAWLYGEVDLNMVMRIWCVASLKDQRKLIAEFVENMPDLHYDGKCLWEPGVYQYRIAFRLRSEQLQPYLFSDKEILDARDDRKGEKTPRSR